MQDKLLKMPAEFLFSPINQDHGRYITLKEAVQLREILEHEPFYYDISYHLNEDLPYKPWEHPKTVLKEIFDYQQSLNNQIKESFKSRKPNKFLLINLLSLFLISLFWINKQPVKNVNIESMEINKLLRKPVNCKERLNFIMQKPTQYHAFIQLEQLFLELEKIYVKAVVFKQLT